MSPNVYTPSPKFGAPLARRQLRRFTTPALIMFLSVLALWPTAFNRGVLYFVDGFAYVRAGDVAIAKIFPSLGPSGLFKILGPRERRFETLSPSSAGASEAGAKAVLVDRSVYYGLPADLAFRLGGFWIWALVQAAVGVGLLWLTGAHFGLGAASRAASILFAITLTSFPLYANLVLPDVWAGYAILSVCVLSVFGKTMSRAETGLHLAVVTFGCLSHNSIILMILATGLCGALRAVPLLRRWPRREGREVATASAAARLRLPTVVVVCGLAVAAGLAGSEIYAHMVKAILGAGIANPPFMTARLIADGPGRKYLQHRCYGAHFYICGVKTPIAGNSEIFLWGEHSEQGGVYLSSPEARQQLSAQDAEFALSVMLHDPAGVFVSDVSNSVRQLTRIEFDSIFRYDDGMKALGGLFLKSNIFFKVSEVESLCRRLVERNDPSRGDDGHGHVLRRPRDHESPEKCMGGRHT